MPDRQYRDGDNELSPDTRIVGVQADGAATVPQSLQKGEPHSVESVQMIADGTAMGGIFTLTDEIIHDRVDDVVTVSDTAIAESVLFLLERAKQMIEGAGATTVAALRSDQLDIGDDIVVPVLFGGYLRITDLQTVLTHGLSHQDQLVRLRVHIRDQPGEISRISTIIAGHGANIFEVSHERAMKVLSVGNVYLQCRIGDERYRPDGPNYRSDPHNLIGRPLGSPRASGSAVLETASYPCEAIASISMQTSPGSWQLQVHF